MKALGFGFFPEKGRSLMNPPSRHHASSCRRLWLCCSVALALSISVGTSQEPQLFGFVRGDANGDGWVSLTDFEALQGYLFRGHAAPPCLDAADTDDNGKLQLTDSIEVFRFFVLGTATDRPKAPYPESGGDPTTSDELDCSFYEPTGQPEEPGARMELSDAAVVSPGSGGTVVLTIVLTNPSSILGYSGILSDEDGILLDSRTAQDFPPEPGSIAL